MARFVWPTAYDNVLSGKLLAYGGKKEISYSLIFKVLPANGHGSRYHSRAALLEEVVTQQSLSSWPAQWTHSLQLIPRSVDQQLLGVLGVPVGGVEEDKSIFRQDCITHLPSVLGTVALAVFLWLTERSVEQQRQSYAVSWHASFPHPNTHTHLHQRNRDCPGKCIEMFLMNILPISSTNRAISRYLRLWQRSWKGLEMVKSWVNLSILVGYVMHRYDCSYYSQLT